jgi:hypothetical protein
MGANDALREGRWRDRMRKGRNIHTVEERDQKEDDYERVDA